MSTPRTNQTRTFNRLAAALAATWLAAAPPSGWAGEVDGGSATGSGAVAVGPGSEASGDFSTATGYFSDAIGRSSTANGSYSSAEGDYSSAIGNISYARGQYSASIGLSSTAFGNGDIALGARASTFVPGGVATTGNIAIGASTDVVTGINGPSTRANGGNSVAIGTAAQSTGNNSVALGAGSDDGGQTNVVSVGSASQQRRIVNVANGSVGASSTDGVNGGQLYAVQQTASSAQTAANQALNDLQMAVNQLLAAGVCGLSNGSISCGSNLALGAGQNIDANATQAVALGTGAQIVNPGGATGTKAAGAVAIGNGAIANADPSVAIGNGANASGAESVAVGDSAAATGNRAVALGYQATASHDDAVALGYGSTTSAPNTVSVGGDAVGNRRITHVADPVDPQDAATKAYVDSRVFEPGGALAQANTYTDQRHAEALRYAARGVAAAMAAAPQGAPAPGESSFGIGIGHYDGQNAVGAGFAHVSRGGAQLNLGLAAATGGKAALRAGLGWKW